MTKVISSIRFYLLTINVMYYMRYKASTAQAVSDPATPQCQPAFTHTFYPMTPAPCAISMSSQRLKQHLGAKVESQSESQSHWSLSSSPLD